MENARTLRRSVSPLHLAAGVPPLVALYPSSLKSKPGRPGGLRCVGVPGRNSVWVVLFSGFVVSALLSSYLGLPTC